MITIDEGAELTAVEDGTAKVAPGSGLSKSESLSSVCASGFFAFAGAV
jgi:hypothetical protein